jgi:SWI/SNF-related matrix-associated actin-dependent regulator 1 of chromatin subfamily A
VLKDLPPKVRQVIEIAPDKAGEIKAERNVWERVLKQLGIKDRDALSDSEYRAVVAAMTSGKAIQFDEMSDVRKQTAIAKVEYVITHLKNAVEESGKVVCFCHHREVATFIKHAFGDDAVMLIGGMSEAAKDQAVTRFQNDPAVKLFIGNIMAAGTGLTLTASSHVVFAELSWVPGDLTQAEDRCHRIGTKDSVLVQHIVLAGSLDATMAKYLVRKQEIIEAALDTDVNTEIEKLLM